MTPTASITPSAAAGGASGRYVGNAKTTAKKVTAKKLSRIKKQVSGKSAKSKSTAKSKNPAAKTKKTRRRTAAAGG